MIAEPAGVPGRAIGVESDYIAPEGDRAGRSVTTGFATAFGGAGWRIERLYP